MSITLQASDGFRRGTLMVALVLVLAEIGLFAALWRLGMLVDPGADRRAALAFVALGTVVTLQAMGVAGMAWMMVALSRTVLHGDDNGVSLEHPWRRWHGGWDEIRNAWTQGGWVVFKLKGQWRRWYVRPAAGQADAMAALAARLPSGAWLDGPAKLRHLATTTLPILVPASIILGLLLMWAQRALEVLAR